MHGCMNNFVVLDVHDMMAVLSVSSVTTSFISCPLPLPYPLKLYVFVGDSSGHPKLRQILPRNWHNRSALFAVTLFECKMTTYIHTYIRRNAWCRWKRNRRPEFKYCTKLISFQFALMSYRKPYIHFFLVASAMGNYEDKLVSRA